MEKKQNYIQYTCTFAGEVFPKKKKITQCYKCISFLKKKGEKGMIRSNSPEEGGSAQQTVSVVRLPNSQGECRTILAPDRKYNIL